MLSNMLFPWRWKRKVDEVINAKFDLTRNSLVRTLDEVRDRLEGEIFGLGDGVITALREIRADHAELGESVVAALRELSLQIEGRLAAQDTKLSEIGRVILSVDAAAQTLEGRLAAQDANLSEIRSMILNVDAAAQSLDARLAAQDTNLSEIGSMILNVDAAAQTRFNTLDNATLPQLVAEISELREEIYQLNKSLTTELDDTSAHRLRSAASDVRRALAALKNEIAAQLGYSLHDIATQVADQRLWLDRIAADWAGNKERLENLNSDTNSWITNLSNSLHTRLNVLHNVELPELGEQMHELAAAQIRVAAERKDRSDWQAHPKECYVPAKPQPFEAYLGAAQREFPKVFGMWRERLERVRAAFDETKMGNAAHPGDLYSRIFRDFVQIHALGRVLDVGCGVFGRPYYLDAYPAELISGLEPLPMRERADFELVRGIGEYLPWPNGSFSTVISATSLDHSLSLQRCLDEIVRVLRPEGRLLLWIGSTPGAPKFDPCEPDFEPADQYHLFHFDRAWFEPLLDERFALLDRREFKRPGYAHILYSLSPRQPQEAEIAAMPRERIAASSA